VTDWSGGWAGVPFLEEKKGLGGGSLWKNSDPRRSPGLVNLAFVRWAIGCLRGGRGRKRPAFEVVGLAPCCDGVELGRNLFGGGRGVLD